MNRKEHVDEMVGVFEGEVLRELACEPDPTTRVLIFFSWLNECLEARGIGSAILVGGFSVEVYAGSTW